MSTDQLILIVVMLGVFVLPGILRRRKKRRQAMAGVSVQPGSPSSTVNPSMANDAIQAQINAAVANALANVNLAAAVGAPSGVSDGTLGVAEVLSISSLATGSPEATLELDAIGEPKRRVMASLPADHTLTRGDRLYVVLNPDDPSTVSIAPPSMTRGQSLPAGANRLDVLVLGPQLLKSGDKAKGVVKAVDSLPLAEPMLAERGFSKWHMDLEVTPERGWPYRAELTISLSTPEKAARMAHVGAELELRYDPEDTKTVAIDSIAMGYGNPYEGLTSSLPISTQTTTTTTFASGDFGNFGNGRSVILLTSGKNKITLIKELRKICNLSLKEAADLIDSTPQKVKENLSDSDAETIKRQLENVGATVAVV